MTKKIFRSILLSSLIAMLSCFIIVTGVLYEYSVGIQRSRLETELMLAAVAVEQNGLEYLSALDSDGYRITWIAPDGSVIYDTDADADKMENHAEREEIKDALQLGVGESERYSTTLTVKTSYRAVRLSDGSVLRISVENLTVLTVAFGMIQPMLIISVLILILSGVFADRMAKRIVNPLNNLDLDRPLENNAYEEITPLLRRINTLYGQVDAQKRELKRKRNEFEAITGSMNEGLILLDSDRRILSINNAAMKLFNADESCVGHDFLNVERGRELVEAISKAATDGHGETRIERGGGEYQIDVSRIISEEAEIGTVLLTFDVTERINAERNRREFTANVSHELKTPLQSIMGSAELIENGLVKADDMPRFVGHIRAESARLVALIDDIIRLSQLDEKVGISPESMDLYAVAQEIIGQLSNTAGLKNVTLSLAGESVKITGVRRLIAEIIFNLCDNAVKYNINGGKVDIHIGKEGKNAVITVSDNGIGISSEHKARIFERFYRVDKSRSKESGGTGLGLSIVKHAVQYHRGKITLESEVGKGSKFSVILPTEFAQNDLSA